MAFPLCRLGNVLCRLADRVVVLGERHGRGDVREVREALREVAEDLPCARVVLLAEQTEVVGGLRGPVECSLGLLDPSLPGEALDEPEGAREERALLALQAVV